MFFKESLLLYIRFLCGLDWILGKAIFNRGAIFSEMNHPKTQQDANFDLEQQFILRMPDDAARYLAEDIDVGIAFKVSFLRCVMRHIYGSR